ncbi:hypothetical protein AB0I49_07490 [Streptomyces sp. NPDC050617]|uniref:hypothetical protein n=1 Tax=Streptomyces sp. NPDC050617 TaxID=3154628 RepID=UPI0034339508
MSRRQPNEQLTALLAEAEWSAGVLAREVNALGAARELDLHYTRSSVACWLNGSRPPAPVPELVAQVLSRRTGRLLVPQDTGLAQLADRTETVPIPSLEAAESAEPVRRLVALCRGDIDPARRAFLAGTEYSPLGPPLPAWPDATGARPPSGPLGRAAPVDIRKLDDMARLFSSLSAAHGGAHARTSLASYLADDVAPLLLTRAPDGLHSQLCSQAARLTHLLATMTADTGYEGLAQLYFRTALSMAREGGDRPTYAITLRVMSGQALRLGHPDTATRLIQGAVRTAEPGAGPDLTSFLLTQRALIHAAEGRSRLALTDLEAAEEEHGSAAGPAGPFTAYPRAGLDYQRAAVFRALGRPDDSLTALRGAVRHRKSAQRLHYALTQAHLAESLLRVGHLEAACSHWHTFLDHYPHLRSVRIDHALARLQRALLAFPRQPHASALSDRARTLASPVRGR